MDEQRRRDDTYGYRRRSLFRLGQPLSRTELLVHVHAHWNVRLSLQHPPVHDGKRQRHQRNAVDVADPNQNYEISTIPDANAASVHQRDGDGQADGCARVANSHVLGEAVASRVDH